MRSLACVLCLIAIFSGVFAQRTDNSFQKDKVALAKLSSQRDSAKSGMLKNKGNTNLKHSFVRLNDSFAEKTMSAGWLSPHDKYSTALKLYRYSLKVDPSDAIAQQWVSTIESIYKSMHRPIPK